MTERSSVDEVYVDITAAAMKWLMQLGRGTPMTSAKVGDEHTSLENEAIDLGYVSRDDDMSNAASRRLHEGEGFQGHIAGADEANQDELVGKQALRAGLEEQGQNMDTAHVAESVDGRTSTEQPTVVTAQMLLTNPG